MCIILRRVRAGAVEEHKFVKWKLSPSAPEKQNKTNKQKTNQKAKMDFFFSKTDCFRRVK